VLSLQFTHVHSFTDQGGPGGPFPPKIFRTYSHLCFERWYHKRNSVIRHKSNILAPKIFGLGTLLSAGTSCQTCERIVLLLVFIV